MNQTHDQLLIDITSLKREVQDFHKDVNLLRNALHNSEDEFKRALHNVTERVNKLEERISELEETNNGKVFTSGNNKESKGF